MLNVKENLCVTMAKSMDSGPRLPWFKASLCYLLSWVTLGKLLSLSVPQFPHLESGHNNSTYPTRLLVNIK